MTRSRRQAEAGLSAKVFELRNSHHHFYVYRTVAGEKSPIVTRTSHGMAEIGDSRLGQMARQCRLSKADFLRLIDCPLDRAEYEARPNEAGELQKLERNEKGFRRLRAQTSCRSGLSKVFAKAAHFADVRAPPSARPERSNRVRAPRGDGGRFSDLRRWSMLTG